MGKQNKEPSIHYVQRFVEVIKTIKSRLTNAKSTRVISSPTTMTIRPTPPTKVSQGVVQDQVADHPARVRVVTVTATVIALPAATVIALPIARPVTAIRTRLAV